MEKMKREEKSPTENARLVLKESAKCLLKFFCDGVPAFFALFSVTLTTIPRSSLFKIVRIYRELRPRQNCISDSRQLFNWIAGQTQLPRRRLFRLTKGFSAEAVVIDTLQIIKTDNRTNVSRAGARVGIVVKLSEVDLFCVYVLVSKLMKRSNWCIFFKGAFRSRQTLTAFRAYISLGHWSCNLFVSVSIIDIPHKKLICYSW